MQKKRFCLPWQISGIWNDIPWEGHGDVLVCDQTVAVVPEVVLGVHAAVVQQSVLPAKNDFVPQHNLGKNRHEFEKQ